MDELKQQLQELQQAIQEITEKLELEEKKKQISSLEADTMADNFWQDEQRAKKIMQNLSHLQAEVQEIEDMQQLIAEQSELIKLAEAEDEHKQVQKDIATMVKQLEKRLDALETKLFLSGSYDSNNAILSIHAGQGGTEAMDWVSMLLRMYLNYFESQDWKYEVISESAGEEAGLKEVTLLVNGAYAFGYLKREQGTHRLVRQSPFNADNLRQTSFALVEVLPEIDETQNDIDVNDNDLEWDFFRSSGKGGQNVNKVSTAVRVRHVPTNIVVECQAQRTQVQNRKLALSILQGKLWEKQQEAEEKKLASIKGSYTPASWGTQIRNYVLHPYQLVKDLRTEVETSDSQSVLDGNIDNFIQAEIRL